MGRDRGVIFGVGVIVGNGTDHHGKVLHDLEGEEEGYTPKSRDCRGKGEAEVIAIK